MSLRKLPAIKAFERPSGLEWDAPAIARWRPELHAAATEGEAGVISLYEEIGEDPWDGTGWTAKRLAGALRSIGADKPITVNINSPGGDFFEGVALYTLLREHKAEVTVRVVGLAASAASIVAMAGDRIEISDVGFLMVHNTWAVAMGNRHDFREFADMLEPFDAAMADLYAARSGKTAKDAAAWMDAETWFNATSAIEAGLADARMSEEAVIEDADAKARLPAERRLDAALARAKMPRTERRALMNELKGGKPGAAPDAMHDAGEWMAAARGLIETLKH